MYCKSVIIARFDLITGLAQFSSCGVHLSNRGSPHSVSDTINLKL